MYWPLAVPPVPSKLTPSYRHTQTHDVFQQAGALSSWTQDYIQISEGAFSGFLTELSLGPIQLFRESMDKAVDEQGQPRANTFAIGVPMETCGDGYWCGDALIPDSIFFLQPNAQLQFRTPMKSDICVAMIDCELLNAYAENTERVSLKHLLATSGVQEADPLLCMHMRRCFTDIFDGLRNNHSGLDVEPSRHVMLSDIMSSLFDGLHMICKVKNGHRGQFVHRHIVEKAKEFILSRQENPPTILEICDELRISRRTLHYGFTKVLGINPVTFLRFLRLNGARRDLLSAEHPLPLICDVAARWGFWHMGMFSTYYKELFGENPSQTTRLRG
ncbi:MULTISPECIES: helix-turn-helix domain-containing protein [unclassified Pseudomonas]|uniref:helix-turn-helix domain-containing protein n=1 Tax=unclassified Pseudomonas TaxID=196821 RepID=UPI000CD0CAD3|nr:MULTISPECIES: helix-turn-helix domain-containing protein [unclassified Pseudomonas]POA28194.1 hypothetical protein C1887_24920 [Pseudomonas sp. GW456-R21]POA62126.1 hypothetical protein C1884_27705 [Pseudomonas sp. GW460-R15]